MDVGSMRQMINRALGSVRQALRGRLQRAKAGQQVILVQAEGLAGEPFNDAELFQQPGLRSVPLAGMQTIIVPLGGRSANGVVIAASNGGLFIADLQPGEVAIFNESDGAPNSIILRNGKIIDIKCATLNIEADTTIVSGDVQVGKTLTASTDVVGGGKSLKGHVHKNVAAGSALSGPPQ